MEQSSVPPQIDLRSQSEPEPISSNPSSSSPPPPSCINNLDVLDIGILLQSGSLTLLPETMKLKIVNHTLDPLYNYPYTKLYGINHRFKVEWAKITHGCTEDGVYCKACALFAPSDIRWQKLGLFVTRPFQVWTKQSSAFHEQLPPGFHD